MHQSKGINEKILHNQTKNIMMTDKKAKGRVN